MDINKFLEQFVEGYLFCDIESMLKIELEDGQKYGACGYPVVMSVLAGMELLGGLLSKNTFDKYAGDKCFDNYWDNYFCIFDHKYKISGIKKLVRGLIRHGLAHNSITKQGIFIGKDGSVTHWHLDKEKSQLFIDFSKFYKDFRASYNKFIKNNPSIRSEMQIRLNEMIKEYSKEAEDLFGKIGEYRESPPIDNIDATMIHNASTMRGSATLPPSGMWDKLATGKDIELKLTPISGSPFDDKDGKFKNFIKNLNKKLNK